MTREEKFAAIVERVPILDGLTDSELAVFVIASYMDSLYKEGVISYVPVEITERGKMAVSLCEEFDFNPTDAELDFFITGLTCPADWDLMKSILVQYRDDREAFLTKIRKFRDGFGDKSSL